jgi:hypothetical protein
MPAAAALEPEPAFDNVRLIGGNINGRYTLTAGAQGLRCFACRAQSISPRSVAISAPVSGVVGEPVNIHFPDFGILQASISRVIEFGFVADLLATTEERQRIAAKIRWLRKHTAAAAPDQRQHKRRLPRSPRSTLLLGDGTRLDCFIIDMSSSGVAVSADYAPGIGQPLAIGRAVGRVVRHLELGFAVQFVVEQDVDGLDRVLRRFDDDAAPSSGRNP